MKIGYRMVLNFLPALAALQRRKTSISFVLSLCFTITSSMGQTGNSELLWQIGQKEKPDFAMAPNQYGKFKSDGFFVVGKSDAKADWPYVHPGPVDGWAGGRQHTFEVLFGLKQLPTEGDCRLSIYMRDTHSQSPPELIIQVNGRAAGKQKFYRLPKGGGDASIFGDPQKGKRHQLGINFPSNLLKIGANSISITTRSGSWFLYEWVGMESPLGGQICPITGTWISSVISQPALREMNGKLHQTVELTYRHVDEKQPALVQIAKADTPDILASVNAELLPGVHSLELPIPASEQEYQANVSVQGGGKFIAAQKVTVKPVRKWVVYLLPHSHVDIGYTHVQSDVERAQWKYLETAIATAKKTAGYPTGSQFKWNVEVLWAVDSYLQQAPREQRLEFYNAVKSGQVGLDALYGNMLTGLSRPEEMLRLLRLAGVLSQRSGVPVESAMITDVPGYTWGIVSAFAHSGVKYFSIGPNGGDRIGHTAAAWGDKPFWWIGPNGKDRILVWMTGTGYYQVFQSPQRLFDYLAKLEGNGYSYDYVQVRHCLGDNGAPDVNFAETVKAWNEKYAYPKLVIATTAEMFRDFEKRYGKEIPTAKGDFTPYWEDGAASSALETGLARASAERLVQAESLFALFNSSSYPLVKFYQAWRNVVLYNEHTWGAHNSISQPDDPFVKSQWATKQSFALVADKMSRELMDLALSSRGEPTISPEENVNVIDVIECNGLMRPYGLVVVPKELSTAGDVVKYSLTNTTAIPAQRLTSGELIFRACWGPYSNRRYYITKGSAGKLPGKGAWVEGNTLNTEQVTLRVDEKTGSIISLKSTKFPHDLVDTNAMTALNDYFYLPGSDLKNLQRSGPVKMSIKENGPLIVSFLLESDAPGCRKLTREIRLHAVRHYIEIINNIDKLPVRTKEGVHFGFGFNVPDGELKMDVPWGVVRPEIDQIPGACKNWFTVQRWVDIQNRSGGVTWLPVDAPLIEIGGITANLIGSLSNPKSWKDKIEPSSTVYSWAMNNHWHTNYRAEQEGPTVFRYFIWPHERLNNAQRIASFAMEMNHPIIVAAARGQLPEKRPFMVNGTDIIITAFKVSDDGKAFIIRLYGTSEKADRAEIVWEGIKPRSVWISDNGEQPKTQVKGSIDVGPYGIVTLRVETE